MKKLIKTTLAIGAAMLLMSCAEPDKATKILQQQGYTEIEITGWRPWMASDSDDFSTGFRAKSPNGTVVTGAVTGGVFKGHTIRLD